MSKPIPKHYMTPEGVKMVNAIGRRMIADLRKAPETRQRIAAEFERINAMPKAAILRFPNGREIDEHEHAFLGTWSDSARGELAEIAQLQQVAK